ncbi:DNA mismatch repair protein MutL [Athelia psychrophila]|uniref:DNA mismatch repair protein MutL n=1 Tax=Athelia psychrophila TaxID=1759441 RepID=A0A166DPA9_9AGAM|nr:DNA mismatch repair protein MutL [Fibularhizoctonia sp. CBS 109695]
MERDESPAPSGPLPIRRLQETLINRIAAGEAPASALKELIENCLDAGSTSIKITVKEGGMKLLQIQDNGCGIRKSDLAILAERFTTSKLSTFSDLSHLTTYGFRGEALASMSHVSHLSVITKTNTDNCAWKAHYSDGALTSAKAGLGVEPKPCAGNNGTTITIEDLFYNTPTRLSALRSSSEEYGRILDVVTKYAVHNPSVSFVCKKAGSPSPELTTPSTSEVPQTIRLLYGPSIGKELLHATAKSTNKRKRRNADEDADDPESWSAQAHFTNANYQGKKMVFLLFINHRLVESSRIRKALEAVYSPILPKGASPFIYLSLLIDPRSVDVNVHPTKKEVHFLNEEEIVEQISNGLQEVLVGQNQSRAFEYQTLLTGGLAPSNEQSSKKGKAKERAKEIPDEPMEGQDSSSSGGNALAAILFKTASQHKVRISMQDRTLESMFPVVNPAQIAPGADVLTGIEPTSSLPPTREIKETACFLGSVGGLRDAVSKGKHTHLSEIVESHVFVGIVDLDRCLSLLQHSTKLYLVNHGALAEELFYQLGLRQFGNFGRLKLNPPPPLRTLVDLALDAEDGIKNSMLSKEDISNRIVDAICSRREMLAEYFALHITADGMVESLPLLLRDYTPNLDKLPSFLMRLGPQVDWSSEANCFGSFLRELAYFYVPGPLDPSPGPSSPRSKGAEKAERWQIEHVLFPTMRRYLSAPKSLLDHDVVQVANLPDLYRVFERC